MTNGNRRKRITGGLHIMFDSEKNLSKDDIVIVTCRDHRQGFWINSCVYSASANSFEAIEAGYFAENLTRKTGFHPSELIDLEVEIITDIDVINGIKTANAWT